MRLIKLGAAFVLLFVIVILLFTLKLGLPNHQLSEGFWVTLSGSVLTSENEFDRSTKPTDVKVYYPFRNLKNLCEGRQIDLFKISWAENGNEGNYSATFWLPVEMEVIVTPNCYGCVHERIFVSPSENNKKIDLKWDTQSCTEEIEKYTDPTLASKRADRFLKNQDEDFASKSYSENYTASIKLDIKRGKGFLTDETYTTDPNTSLFYSHYALFYAWKVEFKIELFDLGQCLEKVQHEINTHNNSCYILPYEGSEDYKSAKNKFYSQLKVMNDYDEMTFGEEELNQVKNAINGIANNVQGLRNANRQCDKALTSISKSLGHQKPYCERRKITLEVINWVFAALALIVGLLIGKYGRKWDKI